MNPPYHWCIRRQKTTSSQPCRGGSKTGKVYHPPPWRGWRRARRRRRKNGSQKGYQRSLFAWFLGCSKRYLATASSPLPVPIGVLHNPVMHAPLQNVSSAGRVAAHGRERDRRARPQQSLHRHQVGFRLAQLVHPLRSFAALELVPLELGRQTEALQECRCA